MGGYIFGCVALAFISAVLYHISHSALRDGARLAMGVLLLSFAVAPVGTLLSGAFDIELPKAEAMDGAYTEVAEEAYCIGIAKALSEKYSAPQECFLVTCEGFVFETMYSSRVKVTLTGKAAVLDYRAVREYVFAAVNTGECDVEIEIG